MFRGTVENGCVIVSRLSDRITHRIIGPIPDGKTEDGIRHWSHIVVTGRNGEVRFTVKYPEPMDEAHRGEKVTWTTPGFFMSVPEHVAPWDAIEFTTTDEIVVTWEERTVAA
jgi:hypothetical protein